MHYYEKDGLQFPSVTTIISNCTNKSAPLTQWAANQVVKYIKDNSIYQTNGYEFEEVVKYEVPEQVLEQSRFEFRNVSQEALDVGSETHACIEYYLKNNKEPKIENNQVIAAFLAFLEWQAKNQLEMKATEKTIYCESWAGTLDFYGKLNNKFYIIDWKISKAIYPESRYQIAAYRYALSKTKLIDGCGILRIDKETGLPEFKDTTKTYKKDLKVFFKMVALYFTKHPVIAKKAGWEEIL